MAENEIKLNAEEQAAVDRAQKDNQAMQAKLYRPGDPPLSPMRILGTEEGRKLIPEGASRDVVTIMVPKAFNLNLTHHHRYEFPVGVMECPKFLLDHWYVRGNGVTEHAPAKSSPPSIALGASTIGDPVKIGNKDEPLGPIIVAALAASGLSTDKWNALPDEERDAFISAEIKKRNEAAKVDQRPAGRPFTKG